MIRIITNYIGRKIRKFLAIRHYKRMIKWAKRQPLEHWPNYHRMEREINEDYFAPSCSYCRKFIAIFINRLDCELNCGYNEDCSCVCCDGLWDKMADSTTWKEWIEGAEAVLKYIRKNG